MWIRSQDKENLVKANRIIISNKRIVNQYLTGDDYDLLGDYESKERAIEVLDEIQYFLIKNNGISTYKEKGRDKYFTGIPNTKLYQMPEK